MAGSRLYASADAFTFSSLTETLGLVVLSAGARATAERRTWAAELDRPDARYREILAGRARDALRRDTPGAA